MRNPPKPPSKTIPSPRTINIKQIKPEIYSILSEYGKKDPRLEEYSEFTTLLTGKYQTIVQIDALAKKLSRKKRKKAA